MMNIIYFISFCFLALSLLFGFYRLIFGPSRLDRILAFDTLCIVIIGFIILFSMWQNSIYFVEILLIFCLLGFTSTVAFLDYLLPKTDQEEEHG